MRLVIFSSLILSTLSSCFSQNSPWEQDMISVTENETEHVIMGIDGLRSAHWDSLPQPQFWREIMLLSPDSVIINVAETRQVIERTSHRAWWGRTEAYRAAYRDSVRTALALDPGSRINVTNGKSDFYRFDLVYETLPMGVACFDEYGVDPWYAQSILLIESPGQLAKSSTGAYGPFQLMPAVARSMGLSVNKNIDERRDFKRSAYGAAQLLKRTCIPLAKSIAQSAGLEVDEHAVWFRLLVMHVYHAGGGNVRAVVNSIGYVASGEELIQRMWVTTAAKFGNSSQNYSQLALAAHLQLSYLIESKSGSSIYKCVEALMD